MVVNTSNIASADDALVGHLMHPRREQYPDDFKQFFCKKVMATFSDASNRHVVTSTIEHGHEVIPGYATWERRHLGNADKSIEPSTPGITKSTLAHSYGL